jgi:hypothetical protein
MQNLEVFKFTLVQERFHYVVGEFQKETMCLLALAIYYFIGTGLSDELVVCKMSSRGCPSLRARGAGPNQHYYDVYTKIV